MEKCIDISKHQTAFNANTCKSAGVTTVICRLAYGTSQDTKVSSYMSAAKNAGLSVGGYGFGTWHYKSMNNGNLSTARTLMKKQVSAWIEIAQKYGCNSWLGIDQELESSQSLGLSVGDNTTLLCEAAELIEEAGLTPCLYASASWIIAYVSLTTFKYPLWVAYYKWYGTQKNFDNVSETFPANSGTYGKWMNEMKDRICMWQFTSEGYASTYGCTHGSNGLDKNWLYFQPGESSSSSGDSSSGSSTSSGSSGTTSSGGSFDEYCLFPMDCLRVTQGVGFDVDGVKASTYSHLCTSAYDLGGEDTSKSPVRAPFSCTVKRIYNGSTASTKCNFTWYVNTKRVKILTGEIIAAGDLFFMTAHCNDDMMTKYGIKVGASFAQGEICGYEGTAGNVANHCHITFGRGPWDGYGWHAVGSAAPGNYEINNPLYMHQICWLRSDCVVKNGYGYPWSTLANSALGTVIDTGSDSSGSSSGSSGSSGSTGTGYQIMTIGPVTNGDALTIYNKCVDLKVVAKNKTLYSSAYADADKKTQKIVIGPVSDLIATSIYNLCVKLKLTEQGLYTSVVAKSSDTASVYFAKYTGSSKSIITALKAIGEESSYSYRAKIAEVNDIDNYKGTAAQNLSMVDLLKQGKLVKP